MLEITEVAVKNGQSKDSGYIGHARNRTKRNKTHKNNTTQKFKKMSNTDSTNTG